MKKKKIKMGTIEEVFGPRLEARTESPEVMRRDGARDPRRDDGIPAWITGGGGIDNPNLS